METLFKTVWGWVSGGWQQLVLGLAITAAVSGWAYVQGRIDGGNTILAGQTKAYADALKDFRGSVDGMVKQATDDAFSDFDDRLQSIDRVANDLRNMEVIQNANAQKLAGAMRGRFVLTADERLRFECVRRPADARCAAAPSPTVRAAVP